MVVACAGRVKLILNVDETLRAPTSLAAVLQAHVPKVVVSVVSGMIERRVSSGANVLSSREYGR